MEGVDEPQKESGRVNAMRDIPRAERENAGQIVKRWRLAQRDRKLSQADLAAIAGVSLATISRVENGVEVSDEYAWKVAQAIEPRAARQFLEALGLGDWALGVGDWAGGRTPRRRVDLREVGDDDDEGPTHHIAYQGPKLGYQEEETIREVIARFQSLRELNGRRLAH